MQLLMKVVETCPSIPMPGEHSDSESLLLTTHLQIPPDANDMHLLRGMFSSDTQPHHRDHPLPNVLRPR